MDYNFKNKNILVCGSTYGIGFDIAKKFYEKKANVIFTGRTVKKIEIIKSKYKKSLAIECDFSDDTHIENLKIKVKKNLKNLDTIVCNIGSGKSKPNFEETYEDWLNIFNINLMYAVKTIKILSPLLKKKKGSTIIFISSICGCEATSAPMSYSSAKSALNIFAKNLSNLYIKKNIRVNAVSPGNVLFKGSTWDYKLKENRLKTLDLIKDKVPINRFATPDEISNVVLFLASDFSSFIVGQNIIVDGGQTNSL